MNPDAFLQRFNHGLIQLREAFHKTGRLDDSNAKLDEIAKLLCIALAATYEPDAGIPSLSHLLRSNRSQTSLVQRLNAALSKAARVGVFRNPDGESLLGANPRFQMADSEDELAARLTTLVVETFDEQLNAPARSRNFELMNEAFGHFVRDNFRNNIEDAQYMTPPEAVDFMCELALDEAGRMLAKSDARKLVVCDPSCGVGSFLAQFYRVWRQSRIADGTRLELVGQDKVDRMARLAKLNLLLFGATKAVIARGNSVLPGSSLDDYAGGCDLILTNPPFGARFRTSELAFHSHRYFPMLNDFIQTSDATIDSEVLFLDRYLSLLRPGGAALVVVPDGVISASGLPALLRDMLPQICTLVSITELPAVTFAQAGTRTKTCILHLRKQPCDPRRRVFFSSARSIGFEVASRKGVPYKRPEGTNELPALLQAMRNRTKPAGGDDVLIHNEEPSCVSLPWSKVDSWTPNHHSARRYTTLATLGEKSGDAGFELLRLREMVTLPNLHQRSVKPAPDAKCISVLHVGDFGSLNVRELAAYAPKFPGQPCRPGDILFSKINPRIPRAIVVPDLGMPLSCSTEFEVMRSRDPYTAHEIMLLLLSSSAQSQILSLTSGTSSSHNRIKTEQLLEILLPVPRSRKKLSGEYVRLVDRFRQAHQSLTSAAVELHESWAGVDGLLRR